MYSNVFYFRSINKIGGTEQFLYEIANKYKKYDITFCFEKIDHDQYKRLSQYVRLIQARGKIQCKKAFFSYTIDSIDNIEAEEYYFVAHANCELIGITPPILDKRLTRFIGVSKFACIKLEEMGEKLGRPIKTELCYNPYTIEKVKKPKVIVVACRLDDVHKGGKRVLRLIEELDRYVSKTDEHYMLYIFSNPCNIKINSPNVFMLEPRVDIRPYMLIADFVAQLSDDMETYCYTINQALSYGVPIITTPLSVLKELPINDNMKIELNWDCSNIDKVVKEIFKKKIKKFKYTPPKDNWENILVKSKSTYNKEKNQKVNVTCLENYTDLELNRGITENEELIMLLPRARELENKGLVKIWR